MRSISLVIVKNAIANVVRGGASAIVAIVLPHFLTRALGPDRFSSWALMLQIAAYANYLDFGVQTSVARYIAGALDRGDREQQNRIVSSAVAVLTVIGLVTIIGFLVVAWRLPRIFPSVPPALVPDIRVGVIVLGVCASIGLPLSVFAGVLVGMQRNEFLAVVTAVTRACGAAGVLLMVQRTQSVGLLALVLGACNLIGAIMLCVIASRFLPNLQVRIASVTRKTVADILRYCATLSIWSFGMLMISGLDLTIIGMFEFAAVGAYSVAATLITFFVGINSAAFSALLAPVAVFQSRNDYSRISIMIIKSTRLSSYFSLAAIAVTFIFGEGLVKLWVGPSYINVALPVLQLLVVAQAIRLIGNGFGTALVGMGLQKYGLVPVFVEGSTNLILSLLGVLMFGPIGVAGATLVAALIAVGIYIFSVMPRVPEIRIRPTQFAIEAIAKPCLAFVPLLVGAVLFQSGWIGELSSRTTNFLSVVLSVFTIFLVLKGIKSARALVI